MRELEKARPVKVLELARFIVNYRIGRFANLPFLNFFTVPLSITPVVFPATGDLSGYTKTLYTTIQGERSTGKCAIEIVHRFKL